MGQPQKLGSKLKKDRFGIKILSKRQNRSTNAIAESFNSKIKGFRANLRGVTDVKFFLFRLEKLFA